MLKKYNEVQQQIKEMEKQYIIAAQKLSRNSGDSVDDDDDDDDDDDNEDALDAYMTQLSSGIVDKKAVSNLKIQLQSLRSEGDHLRKLVNIAKPASLPELVPSEELSKLQTSNRVALVAAVKRKVKDEQMSKMSHKIIPDVDSKLEGVEEQEEEEDEEEEQEQKEADKEEQNNRKRNQDTGGNRDQRTVKQSEQEAVSLNSRGEKREQLHTEKKPCTLDDNSVIGNVVRPKIIGPSLPPSVNLNEGKEVVVNKNKKRSRQKEPKNVKGKWHRKWTMITMNPTQIIQFGFPQKARQVMVVQSSMKSMGTRLIPAMSEKLSKRAQFSSQCICTSKYAVIVHVLPVDIPCL